MINIRQYSNDSKALWNAFNAESKNGLFMFNRGFMDYHQDRFKDNSLLFYEGDKLLALLPLNAQGSTLHSHQGLTFGGFITNLQMKQEKMLECFEALKEYCVKCGFEKLLYKAIPYIYHKFPAQEDLYALFRNNARLFRVDCSASIDLNTNITLPKGRKSQISRAKRENVKIQDSDNFAAFTALLNEVLTKRYNTKAVHSAKELELLHSRFKENIKLFVAKRESEILAAALLFIYPNLVHTQYLAVNDDGRRIGALDLLLSDLIDSYKGSKTYFDFGISNEANGTFLNTGLISQKESFGARVVTHNFYELSWSGGGAFIAFLRFLFYFYFFYLLMASLGGLKILALYCAAQSMSRKNSSYFAN